MMLSLAMTTTDQIISRSCVPSSNVLFGLHLRAFAGQSPHYQSLDKHQQNDKKMLKTLIALPD
jgi:hypothetical protein